MLDMLKKRLEELKANFETAQANIKTLTEQLDGQKSLAMQLMGHYNEANHLYNECKKLSDLQGTVNDKELDEKCCETEEQREVA